MKHFKNALIACLFSCCLYSIGQAAEPVYINTPEGIARLNEASLNKPYFLVAPYIDTQENLGFCAPASMAAILNSLPGVSRPISNQFGSHPYFTQATLFNAVTSQVKPYATVARSGMTLLETSRFLDKLNVTNRIYYGTELSQKQLRILISASLADPHQRIIANFSRQAFGQVGDGHYSPLVAYDARRDSVLIADVAKFKYLPFWVTLDDFLTSIRSIDPDSQRSRGLIIVTEPH